MKLHRMLQDLVNESPGFGRKKYMPTISNNKKTYLNFYYDDTTPKIKKNMLSEFMKDNVELNTRETSYTLIHYDIIMEQRRQYSLNRQLYNPRYINEYTNESENDQEQENEYISDSDTNSEMEIEEE